MPGAEPRRPFKSRSISLSLCIAVLAGTALPAAAEDSPSAVILLYHHVSDTTPRSTSIEPELFDRHLAYLAEEGFTVLPLDEIVAALDNGAPLPPKAVGLSFDDAYRSIYTQALPRLESRGWPFTVFVSTDAIDRGFGDFMSWDELRELESRGGTLANHSTDHGHLVRQRPGEDEAAWRDRVRGNIRGAQARLEAELARPSRLFAYPYGEFDARLEAVVGSLGLVAFGQQSGPIGPGSDRRELARFPMATGFDSLSALAEKLKTRPLPVEVLAPASRILPARSPAPALELRISEGPYRRAQLTCYVAGQAPARVRWSGDVAVIEARAPLGPGRSKYNCTAPSATDSGIYYWYSHLWMQPLDDGSWYPD